MPASLSVKPHPRPSAKAKAVRPFAALAGQKILQVVPALGDGGVEQSALEMALFLQQHGVANGVASAVGAKVKRLQAAKIPHHTLPLQRKNPLVILLNAWRLRRLIQQENYTLVHARSRAPAWSAWLATRGTGVKFITTFHGTYGSGSAMKRAYNRVMLRGPVVIANSAFIKAHIVQVYGYPAAQIVVAARGIDPAAYAPAHFTPAGQQQLRRELGLAAKNQVIMCVGRLTRWKGQHELLAALVELADVPDWQAVLVGGRDARGDYWRELQALVAVHPCRERIILAGSRTDVPALLNLATVAVSPSTRPEAFGRAAIEAQAAGVPVVATALGGSLETVKDGATGYLVAPHAPHCMAERLRTLLTQPATAARLGTKARQWVNANFTVAHCCMQEALAYQRLLAMTMVTRYKD